MLVGMKKALGFAVVSAGLAFVECVSGCIELQGIESEGDGLTSLNLTILQATLGFEPFDLADPIFPTTASCAGGLETPISMRNLLGE